MNGCDPVYDVEGGGGGVVEDEEKGIGEVWVGEGGGGGNHLIGKV